MYPGDKALLRMNVFLDRNSKQGVNVVEVWSAPQWITVRVEVLPNSRASRSGNNRVHSCSGSSKPTS
jgi:hypothetical protein